MTSCYCDTEVCENCGQATIEGNDQNGQCRACTSTSLDTMLRAMAAGVTRDRKSGRFVSITKER